MALDQSAKQRRAGPSPCTLPRSSEARSDISRRPQLLLIIQAKHESYVEPWRGVELSTKPRKRYRKNSAASARFGGPRASFAMRSDGRVCLRLRQVVAR